METIIQKENGMNIVVVGINHKKAPMEIREKFYLKPIERELLLSEYKSNPSVVEALILSTCNRTEIYANVLDNDPETVIKTFLNSKKIPDASNLREYLYAYCGKAAVEHLMRVASGLDSLIIGEKQILGQIKEAVELSRSKGMLSKQFNILSNIAVKAGKKARTETNIDCGGSSVSWAAVNIANDMLGSLHAKSILIIGAGKMSYLAVNQLRQKGAQEIYITNRTLESAQSLASEFKAVAVSFWDIKDILGKVDICICSASAPHFLIEKDLIETVMASRNDKKLLLIDISMPRNIDPAISGIKNVSLLTIDSLDKIVEQNIHKRQEAVAKVEGIICQKTKEFENKFSKILKAENPAMHKMAEADTV